MPASDDERSVAEAMVPTVAETAVVDLERSSAATDPDTAGSGGESVIERPGLWRRYGLFLATVVLPVAVAGFFLLVVAAPRYSSSASFIVRSIDQSSAQDMMTSMAGGLGSTVAEDETHAVDTFLTSRDIVALLAKNDNLLEFLSRPQGDFVFRYPTFWLPDNKEFLYRRFQWMATVDFDAETNISTVEVNAFTPQDAQATAQAMLGYAEALVNRMNERFYESQLAGADRVVAEARKEVDGIEAELKTFRDASGSMDPNLVAKSELTVIEGLAARLAQVEATTAQQLRSAALSPTLSALRAEAQSYRDEIARRKLEIAGEAKSSEASKLQTYDQLILRRTLAVKSLSDAVAQREQGKTGRGKAAPIPSTHHPAQPCAGLGALSADRLGPFRGVCNMLWGVHGPAQTARFRCGARRVTTAVRAYGEQSPATDGALPAGARRSIRVDNLVKEYHTTIGTRRILDGISFEVGEGERVAVLGRNGSGKSTLIRLIGGVEYPTSGRIHRGLFMSWPLAASSGFTGHMTGAASARFVARLYKRDEKDLLAFVDDFAELGRQLHIPLSAYSNGMQARLMFALTLAVDFECLLIDEVLAVGDQRFHRKCHEALFVKRAGKAMLLVSHDVGTIRQYCQRAVVLKAGRGRVFEDLDLAVSIYETL